MDLGTLRDAVGRADRTVDDVADELFDATDAELRLVLRDDARA